MTTKLETYAISHENSSNELIRETPYSAQETVNSQQLAILKKNFPSCFDKNGAFLPNKLAELVGTETEVSQEFYELNWLGRSYAKYLRNAPPEMLMIEDTEHNAEPINQDSQNLLIQGDNLEVLKHLKNAYAEQVKMIYIDPPYNTGSDGFVYQDDRKFTPQQLSELANVPIEEAERILAFTAKGSNSHSAWLTFMYPRLYVARELLKDDGVIFISIDDNEQAQLKLLCDEVFGESNFIACLPVIMNLKGNQDNFGFADTHENCLVYGKNINMTQLGLFDVDDEELLDEWSEDEHGLYKEADNLRATGVNAPRTKRPNLWYPIFLDKEKESFYNTEDDKPLSSKHEIIYPINPEGEELSWYWKKSTFNSNKHNLILKYTRNGYQFYRKQRPQLGDLPTKKPKTLWYKSDYSSSSATTFLKNLFGKKVFNSPKPVPYTQDIIKVGIPEVNDEIILDFFAGSGTTAHAVMQLNADDGGNRQFIAVQIAEPTDSKSEAFKAGYRTIFDITKERIIRASQKIRGENPEAKGDFGFKIYKTTPHLINHNLAFDLNQPELPELLELKPDDYLALLTTWRLYDGAKLTEKVTDIDLDGYTAHLCQQNLYLMYPNFQPKHLIQLIKQLDNDPSFTPNRVVMLGETIDSSRQNEIYQALKDYANKKSLDLSVIVRNI